MALVYEELGARHAAALAALTAYSFHVPEDEIEPWWRRCGEENVRLVREGDDVLGGALLVWMGQFFGGRRVPLCGVAGVAVGPHARGRGVARFLMREVLAEARAKGTPLSSLYASTVPLYRSVGYERAGVRMEAQVAPRELPRARAELAIRPLEERDHAAVAELRSARARSIHGALDLGEYMWRRIREPRLGTSRGFVFEEGGVPQGHAWLHFPAPGPDARLTLLDWSAATPEAFRTLVALLGGHSTVWERLSFPTEPRDPLLFSIPDRRYEIRSSEHWMLRLVDLPAAVAARGYAPGIAVRVELDVADELLPDGAGRFVLEVADGLGRLEPGGSGRVRADARALAALFSAHVPAEALVLAGRLEAAPADAELLTRAFLAPAPAMLLGF